MRGQTQLNLATLFNFPRFFYAGKPWNGHSDTYELLTRPMPLGFRKKEFVLACLQVDPLGFEDRCAKVRKTNVSPLCPL